jgi:hypothetical protein
VTVQYSSRRMTTALSVHSVAPRRNPVLAFVPASSKVCIESQVTSRPCLGNTETCSQQVRHFLPFLHLLNSECSIYTLQVCLTSARLTWKHFLCIYNGPDVATSLRCFRAMLSQTSMLPSYYLLTNLQPDRSRRGLFFGDAI